MFRKSVLTLAILAIGFIAGLAFEHYSSSLSVYAQKTETDDTDRILVQGHGRAISAISPPGEQITLVNSKDPQNPFTTVPAGKKFVLTDVVYETQRSVRQNIVVNIANANLTRKTHDILFQVSLNPGKSDQVHLCSGYVIPAGNTLVAFTGGGPDPEQYVSVAVTGYLADQ